MSCLNKLDVMTKELSNLVTLRPLVAPLLWDTTDSGLRVTKLLIPLVLVSNYYLYNFSQLANFYSMEDFTEINIFA